MTEESIKEILKDHKLRITEARIKVISHFISENRALTQVDLEANFDEFDRVTLYRTLHSFLDSGILHRIPNDSGAATYALCFDTCSPTEHNHAHAHFKCNSCGKMECLDDKVLNVPIELPKGYVTQHVNLIVDGFCSNCH